MTASKKQIPMFQPYINEAMKREVQDTLNTRWIGQGPKVDKFEEELKTVFNIKYPVALNSGTSALWMAYYLIGIKEGDEVITSVLNCSADAVALSHTGAKIVFADIRWDTMNIDPKDIEAKITPNTKAIINVHLSGNPSNIPNFGIPVIGDYSQMHYSPLPCDTYACYSFQAIKQITMGDGGMIVPPNESEYIRAKKLRWFGIDREKKRWANYQAYMGREMTTDIDEPGFKFQTTDIAASLGLGALQEYDKIMGHHEKLGEIYKEGLRDIDGLTVIGGIWSFPVLVERRSDFAKKLAEQNVETNMVQVRNDILTAFGGQRQDLPNMNWIEDKYIHLPLHMHVSQKDARRIVKIIKEGW